MNESYDMESRYPSRLLAPGASGRTTLIIGSSFTGKTYLLCQELKLIKHFEYDLIVLFTESVNAEGLESIRQRPDTLIKEGFNSRIPLFLKNLNNKLGLRFKILLILDDIIGQKSSRQSILGKMITIFRNSDISTCVLLQYPTLIEKHCRSNFHQVVITGMRSQESNKSLTDRFDRFDILCWAKERMRSEGDTRTHIKNDDVYNYLKRLLMKNGDVLYIDMKKSLDPALIRL